MDFGLLLKVRSARYEGSEFYIRKEPTEPMNDTLYIKSLVGKL
jgi:hypothetical protein